MLEIHINHYGNGSVYINSITLIKLENGSETEEEVASFDEVSQKCIFKENWDPEKLDMLKGEECLIRHFRFCRHVINDPTVDEEVAEWWQEDYDANAEFLGCVVENGLWHIEYQVINEETA